MVLERRIAPGQCRTPQGVRGLKFGGGFVRRTPVTSHPARGARIEIHLLLLSVPESGSRTPQGVRGLKWAREHPSVARLQKIELDNFKTYFL